MQMTSIVRKTAEIFYPFCLLYGLYIVAHGHLTAGGGFQGGAIIATSVVLLIVAHRYDDIRARFNKDSLKLCELAGLLGFLFAGLSAFLFSKPFFHNWLVSAGGLFGNPVAHGSNPGDLNTGGLIPLMNLAVGVEVLGALSLIVLYMLSGIKEERP